MAKAQPQFVLHVLEQMRGLGAVRARSFFGGWGIYWDDRIIALIADDVLYFKADNGNRADFEALNLEPFTYETNGKRSTMSYFRAPDEVFDDDEAMTQ
jgi:DNA transformation protein